MYSKRHTQRIVKKGIKSYLECLEKDSEIKDVGDKGNKKIKTDVNKSSETFLYTFTDEYLNGSFVTERNGVMEMHMGIEEMPFGVDGMDDHFILNSSEPSNDKKNYLNSFNAEEFIQDQTNNEQPFLDYIDLLEVQGIFSLFFFLIIRKLFFCLQLPA